MHGAVSLVALLLTGAGPLAAGDYSRAVKVDERQRTYLVHVPPKYDPAIPMPVVLLFHGALMNAEMMAPFCGMNAKADEAGFVAVYPDGVGPANLLGSWNSEGFQGLWGRTPPDDVAFVAKLLDDLAGVVCIDRKRVYAAGLSNGGMMCYRLASQLSERIAAIAAVGGTMAVSCYAPKRPVSVIHFHGTADRYVPFEGWREGMPDVVKFKSVEETIRLCAEAACCPKAPVVTKLPTKVDDGTSVEKSVYGPGKDNSEVVLIRIEEGGHTWPGEDPPLRLLGKSTKNISANDMLWEFFQKHPMK